MTKHIATDLAGRTEAIGDVCRESRGSGATGECTASSVQSKDRKRGTNRGGHGALGPVLLERCRFSQEASPYVGLRKRVIVDVPGGSRRWSSGSNFNADGDATPCAFGWLPRQYVRAFFSMPKTLHLLRDKVALAPMRRKQAASGLIYDMTRMDDRRQWRVLRAGPKATVKQGDHVITQGMVEPLFDFTDGVVIVNCKDIVAVIEGAG